MNFAECKNNKENWITLANGEFYPDACELYKPVLVEFGRLLRESHSSTNLFSSIMATNEQWIRTQMCRVFKKYVSPKTPVEMLKRKSAANSIIENFGSEFRDIVEVQRRFNERPLPDEALCAILWEYKDRGQKGYDLTERLFEIFRQQFPLPTYTIIGPERAGRDILMGNVFSNYPKPDRPVDFILKRGDEVIAIGLARYDSDRGGAQEDDRTGQYREVADEFFRFADTNNLSHIKIIYVNDGPGLLLGTMWDDYAHLESLWPNRAIVVTLRMIQARVTSAWLGVA